MRGTIELKKGDLVCSSYPIEDSFGIITRYPEQHNMGIVLELTKSVSWSGYFEKARVYWQREQYVGLKRDKRRNEHRRGHLFRVILDEDGSTHYIQGKDNSRASKVTKNEDKAKEG